jgi:hypothetical protein
MGSSTRFINSLFIIRPEVFNLYNFDGKTRAFVWFSTTVRTFYSMLFIDKASRTLTWRVMKFILHRVWFSGMFLP